LRQTRLTALNWYAPAPTSTTASADGSHGAPGGFVADSDERIGPPLRALELPRCARSSFPAPTGERPPFHR